MHRKTIALVGNPNCGKSTLFNQLTGSNQWVGNWPGVTVERKEGVYQTGDDEITVVDLPGVYSLDAEYEDSGLDEAVARDYLLSGEADLVVNIVDAVNLERNFYLTAQIMEMRLPMVVVLNKTDLAQERQIDINRQMLMERLGCPIVSVVASRNRGIDELRALIARSLAEPTIPHGYVAYPPVMEDAIASLVDKIQASPEPNQGKELPVDPRWLAVKILESENSPASQLFSAQQLAAWEDTIAAGRSKIYQVLEEDLDIVVADSRYGFVRQVSQGAVKRKNKISTTRSDQIDRIVLNRWLGIPIFMVVMYLMFLFTINVGNAFIDFFDIFTSTIFVDGFGHLLGNWGMPELAIALLADGIGGGIQTVATFIPPIGFLFLFLSILEDSGYMARAAFVMDRLMRFLGLPGKSFVPLLIGFGCNVPAIMATRTLENKRDRLLTIAINPFMSCGARLPVYALFATAFFPIAGQNIVFALYLLGIAAAVLTGIILKTTLLPGKVTPFAMELPSYQIPRFKGILVRTWDRLQGFLLGAGKIIIIMVTILSLLGSVGTDGSFGNQNTGNSVLSNIGRTITPAFSPMGIESDNWPATVGVFSGLFAKEAVVGTLDSLYSNIDKEATAATEQESFDFWGNIQASFATIPANLSELPSAFTDPLGLTMADVKDPETAAEMQGISTGTFGAMVARFDGKVGSFAYMLFILLYFPCVAALGAIYREANLGWMLFSAGWTTGLAYWGSVFYYQAATLSQHASSSIAWIVGLLLSLVAVVGILKLLGPTGVSNRRREFQ